jgi:predicted RNase H-like nuclease
MAAARWIAGVDGCRAGWIVVLHPIGEPQSARAELCPRFADILALVEQPVIVAIDVPIGLPDQSGPGGRLCDNEARKPLGARQSSVFAVPARAAVFEADYAAACATALRHSDPPRKVSKQAFNLFPKIREVDALMTPALQTRVVECHPELAFWRLNGRDSIQLPKKMKSQPNPAGLDLRRELLVTAGYLPALFSGHRWRRSDAGADDLIDACVNAAAAEAIALGQAYRVPDTPPLDSKGLRMEIWG